MASALFETPPISPPTPFLKFNGDMPCITPSVALHAFLRRSQILLTLNRHQMMHNVFCIVACVEVTCKGLFLIQRRSEEQCQALVFNHSQHCFGHMLHFRVYNYCFFFPFSLISQLRC